MRSALVLVLVLVLALACASNDRCQDVTNEMCAGQPYSRARMPNILNHTTVDMAALEAHQFAPLVKVRCSPSLTSFVCLLYFPPCTVLDAATPPCRELCQAARDDCEPLMTKFGFRWPFSCEQFPALLQYSERLQRMQEQSLQMEQRTLRLEQRKLRLEIELLQRQLRSG
ncbi:frizzled-1-like [Pollicipes pollicipes]|uniref:frizzled-1-like n=1 Tax=Pollicipes pollicipes TaxID=41117 RepID=UPI001884E180|nr:frizzled-1-like [Pollicipes pollicipes]